MKKSIELLKTAFEDKLKGKIHNFYIGDPALIPESAMPALIIAPVRTETTVVDNVRDMHTHEITVSIVIDARHYFNATPNKMVGTVFLMDTMEGEDSSAIDDSTVVGVIRNNLTLGTNRFINNISSIDYTVRQRTADLMTLEAVAHVEIQYIVTR